MKSKAFILYGVMNPVKTSWDGAFQAEKWAELRAGPGNWGHLDDNGTWIVWFADPGVRDEFKAIFAGQEVTLDRKPEQHLTGEKALNLMKSIKFTKGHVG